MRGILVAVEGLDAAGTTTLSRALVDRLSDMGFRACYTKEPTDGPVGRLIRAALKGAYCDLAGDQMVMALLFAADRAWHLSRDSVCGYPGVLAALEDGMIVVSDRYKYSSMAYQGSIAGFWWVENINAFAPDPDILVYVDTPMDVVESRLKARGELDIFESDAGLLRRAKLAYDFIIELYEHSLGGAPVVYRAGRASLEEDVDRISEIITTLAVERAGREGVNEKLLREIDSIMSDVWVAYMALSAAASSLGAVYMALATTSLVLRSGIDPVEGFKMASKTLDVLDKAIDDIKSDDISKAVDIMMGGLARIRDMLRREVEGENNG